MKVSPEERASGERVRIAEQIKRMRAALDSLDIALRYDAPVLETAQAVADTATRLANTAARLDAYERVVHDAKGD